MPTWAHPVTVTRTALLTAISLLLLACSPTIRLRVRFVFPAAVVAPASDRFHITGVKACPPAPVAAPLPGADPGDAESFKAEQQGRTLSVEARFRGKACRVQVTGWYDADNDGALSAGDFTGTTVAIDGRDRGTVEGNLSTVPDVVLAPAPTP